MKGSIQNVNAFSYCRTHFAKHATLFAYLVTKIVAARRADARYRKHRSCQPKNGKRTSAESFSSDDYVASLLKHFTLQSWLAGYILTVPAVPTKIFNRGLFPWSLSI